MASHDNSRVRFLYGYLFLLEGWYNFFASSIVHIRQMLNQPRLTSHIALKTWSKEHNKDCDTERLWKEMWHPKISQDKNIFSWQVIYGVSTTLVYHHRWLSITNPSLRCTKCSHLMSKTINHTIFGCSAS